MGKLTPLNQNLIKTVINLKLKEGEKQEPFKFSQVMKLIDEKRLEDATHMLYMCFMDTSKHALIEYRKCELKSIYDFIKRQVNIELTYNDDKHRILTDINGTYQAKPRTSVNYKIDWRIK